MAIEEVQECYGEDEEDEDEGANEDDDEKDDRLEKFVNHDGCVSITFRDERNDFVRFGAEVVKMELKGGPIR